MTDAADIFAARPLPVEPDACADILARARKYYQPPLRDAKLKPDAYRLEPDWLPGDVAADIPPPGHVLGCIGKKEKGRWIL